MRITATEFVAPLARGTGSVCFPLFVSPSMQCGNPMRSYATGGALSLERTAGAITMRLIARLARIRRRPKEAVLPAARARRRVILPWHGHSHCGVQPGHDPLVAHVLLVSVPGHQRAYFDGTPTGGQRHPCARPTGATGLDAVVTRQAQGLTASSTPTVPFRGLELMALGLSVALHRSKRRVRNRTAPRNRFCSSSVARSRAAARKNPICAGIVGPGLSVVSCVSFVGGGAL